MFRRTEPCNEGLNIAGYKRLQRFGCLICQGGICVRNDSMATVSSMKPTNGQTRQTSIPLQSTPEKANQCAMQIGGLRSEGTSLLPAFVRRFGNGKFESVRLTTPDEKPVCSLPDPGAVESGF